MAKALIGHLDSSQQTRALALETARLRARVAELESLVLRLSEENDRLVSDHAHALLEDTLGQMQPA